MLAIERLQSGKLDDEYNKIGRHYETSQGISGRSNCPVYLATKAEVIAIEAAIRDRVEQDLYITDLGNIFKAVLDRSCYDENIWDSSLSNHEYPTPYAYLLKQISGDLRYLSKWAVESATDKSGSRWQVQTPGWVVNALARTWSFCVWEIACSENRVSPPFRNRVITAYLEFVLSLGWQPSEVYWGSADEVTGLCDWRDLFAEELKKRFCGQDNLKEAIDSLDRGKLYVWKGQEWLKSQFGLENSGSA